eukprot:CAMPEP_0185023298 /NCGR_PEP_ID=MMETSP1103-20130426/5985_1 /TAXON_ID=36769 /ORGANISM="Paraphysomonas bandaiensis, Strain Caron Lab Isolate" /LENGTH=70 /DNA_ID=CAMNT_0027555831 /DNA_START=107 /DNA_END=319 /DNA_ORIENTATION=+
MLLQVLNIWGSISIVPIYMKEPEARPVIIPDTTLLVIPSSDTTYDSTTADITAPLGVASTNVPNIRNDDM